MKKTATHFLSPLTFIVLSLALPLGTQAQEQAASSVSVSNIVAAKNATTGVRVLKGGVELPLNHRSTPWAWRIDKAFEAHDGLVEIFLGEPDDDMTDAAFEGERMARLADRRDIRRRQSTLRTAYWFAEQFARDGDGLGPTTLAELEKDDKESRSFSPPEGVFLVPNFRLGTVNESVDPKDAKHDANRWKRRDRTGPFLIDTRPVIDDGKHWILDSWGWGERKEIDPELLKKYDLTITPQRAPGGKKSLVADDATMTRTIYARVMRADEAADRSIDTTIVARNIRSEETVNIQWQLEQLPRIKAKDSNIVRDWAELRTYALSSTGFEHAPLSTHWVRRMAEAYDIDLGDLGLGNRNNRNRRGRTTDAMSILGGRAAIEETLQLRELQLDAAGGREEASIPLSTIKGVEVKAHPFKQMLQSHLSEHGGEAPRLELANHVPPDRFFAYFREPAAALDMLDSSSEYVFSTGSAVTGNTAAYHVKQRYLEQFGISERLLRRFIGTGAVEEMALCLPDLHLIDGTEISAVLKLGKPLLVTAALGLIGVPPGNGTSERKTPSGRPVHLHRDGKFLLVSSSKSELAAMRKAHESGKNLGASHEFQYMLTQVPMTAETSSYFYFSDPFIRHLTGPAAKIGQLRRLAERAELEEASAGALLASYDGHPSDRVRDPAFLEEHGYIRELLATSDLELNKHFVSLAPDTGRANRLRTLSERDLELVTPRERNAYKQYRESYERYWRRFFDPIAIRYEKHPDGTHQLETFILPLIDNSLYNGLRRIAPPQDAPIALRVPVFKPAPVGLLSFNLNEEAMLDMMEDSDDMIAGLLGLDGTILDQLGPDVHIALQDADPIIGIGGGELAGMFGQFGGRVDDMVMIPALVSLLTRPCNICIGVQNPEAMRKQLDDLAWPAEGFNDGRFGEGSLYRVTGEKKWIYRYTIEDVITLRFGVEVQDRYLVINNLPFSNKAKVTGSKPAPNSIGYLELSPGACSKQLPALFASMVESAAGNTRRGAACLTPLMMAGAESIEAAGQTHYDLFGYEPLHPPGGSWTWDAEAGEMVSSLFGSPWEQQQPPFDPAKAESRAVGMLNNVHTLNLGMQFEDDGLRSRIRWRMK